MVGLLNSHRFGVSASGATTTWNPSDKHADILLTNGNLTAEATAAPGFCIVRATTGKNSGLWYFEWTGNGSGPGGGSSIAGLVGGSENLNDYLYQSNGVGYLDNGVIGRNGSAVVTGLGTWKVSGDVCRCAVDLNARRVWFSRVGSNWNNSGSADPATNTGGVDISALPSTLYPGCSVYDVATPDKLTVNFGQLLFAGAIPSGFSAWG